MSFGEKIKNFFLGKKNLNDDLFDDLCDLLIEGDFGAAEAYKTVETLKEKCKKENISSDMLPQKLAVLLTEILLSSSFKEKFDKIKSFSEKSEELTAILLLGVNGVGKTTTAAKLANLFSSKYNKKTILAASDTFRAAAIDQLKIHGDKLNTRVVAHKHGGDPAAVVYDALEAAFSGNADFVIVDTAGRMHTKSALVEELRKIDRVVESKKTSANHVCANLEEAKLPVQNKKPLKYLKFLVLDATTGRNAFAQAEIFHSAVDLDGVILTKYDSTAKGGVVFSLASDLKLPVIFICTGEKYTDIEAFNPEKFVKEFTGIE
ncbi:MAG: signal recognition particle-docking protein FtsY [Treponema sp.]|nr:signal recognition particle-docking protein FtsY [Treponema sp.]